MIENGKNTKCSKLTPNQSISVVSWVDEIQGPIVGFHDSY